jgi:hypothetical protein
MGMMKLNIVETIFLRRKMDIWSNKELFLICEFVCEDL